MSRILSSTHRLEPGGGPFALARLTLGIFLDDQPTHRLAIGGDRRQSHPLRALEGWIMPTGAEGFCEFDAPLSVRMVEIDAALLTEAGLSRPDAMRPVVGTLDPMLVQMALASDRFAGADALYRETMSRAMAAEIARIVGTSDSDAKHTHDPRLSRAIEAIEDDPAADHGLETLAALAAMSPYHFARAFKAATGLAPLQYVIRARMRLAEGLLATTRLPVAEIAWRVGYGDASRFTSHFKRHAGLTPGAFRAG
ncbi:MAG: AraC family transcriptional regulator [Pseudomonadota bacterium]